MSESNPPEDQHYRIRREARSIGPSLAAAGTWARESWREKRWFRLAGYALGAFLVLWFLVWVLVARGLPSADKLLDYQPPLPTMVRGVDGEIVYSYARERRVQLRFDDFPKQLIDAYLAAEDKTFWSHGGVDLTGLAGAVVDYASKIGSGERAKGGSTITQQVAKNILIGDEYSVTRKLKEMVVARRIESVLSKPQILELYLNEIPLGRQSFGVQAASRAYFDKDVGDLELHEAAFLAILPKAPERYGRAKYTSLAIERRNYVLDQMVENGWATREDAEAAKAMPLGLIPRRSERWDPSVGYYVEEVRRRLMERYGEKAEDGPHSVYAGGLWVRTSLDPQLQKATQDALRAGLLRYHGGKGWRGPIERVDLSAGNWQSQLVLMNKSVNYKDWRVGAVLDRDGPSATIGFADGETATLVDLPGALKSGDVIAAEKIGNERYSVRTIPEVSGGMVVEDPRNGRVVAMQGGFDVGLGAFNRATQAMRQPGSTIKPFVYAAGLDSGMTPASMVSDGTFCVYQGARLGNKCFRNFDMRSAGGNHTMRWGLEQSRNLMTIRIANDAGMDRVTRTFDRVGIGKYDRYLSFALGAGETTVDRMVNAYSALANNGVQYEPTLIDYVQDRNGKIIWRADNRRCGRCNMADWDGKPMPRLNPRGKQVLDPGTAYQTLHMLEGVVTRGTATALRDLDLPMFGKTGTTSGPTDVWFVGGSPNMVAGVYLGFDKPRSLGGYAQGGRIAAPIFKQLVQETKPRWSRTPFLAPTGIRMVRIDRASGKRVFAGEPGNDPKSSIIWEAFKPDTEPRRSSKSEDLAARRDEIIAMIRHSQRQAALPKEELKAAEPRDFAEEQGGLY
jgi:penicillin-binding protein 1A